jgi:uncharacterized membrane protein
MKEVVLICSLGIGVVAGLRSMTAPAIVSWGGFVGWLSVYAGAFWWVASVPVVVLLTAWAIFELVIDKTAKIGNRTGLVGLIFRIVTSTFSGAVVSSSAGTGLAFGMISGLSGGMIGAFGGYHLRRACVRETTLSDRSVGIAEDIIAIGLGVVCVYFGGH